MKLLAIEAAASPPSVALYLDGNVFQKLTDEPRAQAEDLLVLVEELLAQHKITLAELDGVAVGRGPGSFTGLRVASATAQGLAYSAGLDVANVSSLAALAHAEFDNIHSATSSESNGGDRSAMIVPGNEERLLVCLDARKAQVYCALYAADELGRPQPVSPETVIDPEQVVAQFEGQATRGIGNGFSQYPELANLGLSVVHTGSPLAEAVARRAVSGAVSFEAAYRAVPEYVRNNVTHGS